MFYILNKIYDPLETDTAYMYLKNYAQYKDKSCTEILKPENGDLFLYTCENNMEIGNVKIYLNQ